MEYEVFTKDIPDKPGRYIIGYLDGTDKLLTITKKGPLDLIYEIDGVGVDGTRLPVTAKFCRFIPSKLAEECYAEGWHAAQYASQKSLGSYFPSYWNDDTFSKRMAEGK